LWQAGDLRLDQRVAWIGARPRRLRMTLRAITGWPLVSAAVDGHWAYLLRHDTRKLQRRPLLGFDLEPVLGVPIRLEDALAFLSGSYPVTAHHSVTVYRQPGQPGCVALLLSREGGLRQKISLDETLTRVTGVEVFTATGDLAYGAEMDVAAAAGEAALPQRLRITAPDGARFELITERLWTDVAVPPTAFQLTAAERRP
jgi:hypothetical protein